MAAGGNLNVNLSMIAKDTDGKAVEPSPSTMSPRADAASPRAADAAATHVTIPNRIFTTHGASIEYKYGAAEAGSGGCLSRGAGPWGSHDNEVITSQYKAWNFIPKNLFLQFSNVANLYFLFIGILQIIGPISTTAGIPTMYEPLAVIVLVSALRAAGEDINKHRADSSRNGAPYLTLQPDGSFKDVRSGDLRVGQVIKVLQNKMIPADILFLGSALPKGHCFIDKANLNGETTLEVMSSIPQTRHWFTTNTAKDFACTLDYEPPNKRFDSFRGQMTLKVNGSDETLPINGKSLLMRETNLKNCEYIYGLIVYVGNDTKIQRSNMEGEKAKTKKSRIMRWVEKFLGGMVLFQASACLFAAFYCGIWNSSHNSDWYLNFDTSPGLAGVLAYFTWFILLSQVVPISLIVSAELVKFVQSWFIQKDITMYYEPIDKPTKCNSHTIHEDLGLIDYIFSDKTGTLTQNKMEFRYALLTGAEFGNKETEIAKSVKARQAEVEARKAGNYVPPPAQLWTTLVKPLTARGTAEERRDCCTRSCFSPCWNHPRSGVEAKDADAFVNANVFTGAERDVLLSALYGPCPPGMDTNVWAKRKRDLHTYCLHMALSNTVKPFDEVEVHPVTKVSRTVLKFQAEAAEELAMVTWARDVGFLKKTEAKPAILEITEYDEKLQPKPNKIEQRYGLQAVLGFTSARARVTVIYQRESDGMIVVMTKGQDTVVLPLLHECPGKEALLIDLNTLCTNGLRTLVNGHAELPASWWNGPRDGHKTTRQEEFARIKDLAETPFSVGHSDGKCNKEKCEKCATHNFFNDLESDAKLSYLGCMGLEDQLQLLVPETIRDFLRAGVKVWMITGDKLETAKNIGLACNLIDPDMPPQLKKGATMKEASDAFAQSRLIEVTGQWAELGDNENELGALFDCFDQSEDGQLDKRELTQCLEALKFNVSADRFDALFKEFDHDNDGHISKSEFLKLMGSVKMSMYDAVKADIDDGFTRYNEIKDHEAYPISVLVSRSAFEVMFPGKPVPGAPVKGKVIAEEELEKLRQKFFHLARHAKSVVFARAQPAMKKKMVTEIQRIDPMAVTLAVGDGANDTDMITAAHIGVGISGVEGTAATNSADYAIGTFRMLHTLLFVHGFWSYQRITTLVYFIFYKASLVAITQYFFGFFSGFAGQQFWNDLPYQFYNVVFTATPIMACAVLNKHLPRSTLENNPAAYREAKNKAFTSIGFLGWVVRSIVHSAILFFIPLGTIGFNNVSSSGDPGHGLWYFSTSVYFCVVLVPTFLIVFEMCNITLLHALTIAASVSSLFLFTFLLSLVAGSNPALYGEVAALLSSGTVWLTMILTVSIPLLGELFIKGYYRDVHPTFTNILQEKLREKRRQRDQAVKSVPQGLDYASDVPVAIAVTVGDAASGQVAIDAHEEKAWAASHSPKSPRKHGRMNTVALFGDNAPLSKDDQLRSALVQAMLRFRNLTGSVFSSAARADLHEYAPMKGEAKESKQASPKLASSAAPVTTPSPVIAASIAANDAAIPLASLTMVHQVSGGAAPDVPLLGNGTSSSD